MATTSVEVAVGNYADSIWYAVMDSAGYMDSNTGTAPAAGSQTGHPMLQIVGLQDFPFAAVDPDTPTQRGDGGALARFINKSTELPGANMTFGASDYDFAALVVTDLVATIGGGSFVGRGGQNPTYRDMLILVVASAKSIETGNTGGMWEGRFIYNANVQAKGRTTFNDSALPTYDYTLVANRSTVFPWGLAHLGVLGDTDYSYVDFTWPYRPICERFTGDNIVTDYNLTKDIAEDSADNIVAYVAGVAQTWVTGVPGAGEIGVTEGTPDVLVFGTAPAAASKIVTMYGWS
jgi:hypothetical protein